MYDSEDTEEFDPDVPTGMGGMNYAENPPEVGDNRNDSRGEECGGSWVWMVR